MREKGLVAEIESRSEPLPTTMLSLVMRLQKELPGEEEVARTVAEWIRAGRVVLTGNFKGQRHFDLEDASEPRAHVA
jgi:hypothetical protein